jgi:predicted aconitase with swiveling domain
MTVYHWLALFVAVNVADALLTLYAMRNGATEANPIMRAAMRVMPAPVALLIVKGAYVVAVGVMLAQLAPWLPWLVAFFGAICAWNMVQIVRMRKG